MSGTLALLLSADDELLSCWGGVEAVSFPSQLSTSQTITDSQTLSQSFYMRLVSCLAPEESFKHLHQGKPAYMRL